MQRLKNFMRYLFEDFTEDAFEKTILGFMILVVSFALITGIVMSHYQEILGTLLLIALIGVVGLISWVIGHLAVRLFLK